ncbi:Protein of unknown function [Pyronema omphalodes CBS 100304]|uniref:Uncharacterized protein n=1 Tax=Pyronema omphalodes (strain CBS 100304) TaxID=1076935 RepID=U4LRL0_PYROM|nr:Protein of unknown function [Pyronema omphalodes CBS 100304]
MQHRFFYLIFSFAILLGGYCASPNRLHVDYAEAQQLAEASSVGTEKISEHTVPEQVNIATPLVQRVPRDISANVVTDGLQSATPPAFSKRENALNLVGPEENRKTTKKDHMSLEDSGVVVQYAAADMPNRTFELAQRPTPSRRPPRPTSAVKNKVATTINTVKSLETGEPDRKTGAEAEMPRRTFTRAQRPTPKSKPKAGNLAAANTAGATETSRFALSKRSGVAPGIISSLFIGTFPTIYSRRLRTKYITETEIVVIDVTVPPVTTTLKGNPTSPQPSMIITSTETTITTKGKSCKAKTPTPSQGQFISTELDITLTIMTTIGTTEGLVFVPTITGAPLTTTKAKTCKAKYPISGSSVVSSASVTPVVTTKLKSQPSKRVVQTITVTGTPVRSSTTKIVTEKPFQSNTVTSTEELYATPTTQIQASSTKALTTRKGSSCKAKTSRHLEDYGSFTTTAMETGILVPVITTLTSTKIETVTRPDVTSKTVTITVTPSSSTISSGKATSTTTETVTRTDVAPTTVTITITSSSYPSSSMRTVLSGNGGSTLLNNGPKGFTMSVVKTSTTTDIKTVTETSKQTITTTDIKTMTTTEKPSEADFVSFSSVPQASTNTVTPTATAEIDSTRSSFYLTLSPTMASQEPPLQRENSTTTPPAKETSAISSKSLDGLVGLTSMDKPTSIITMKGATTTITTTELRTKLTFTTKLLQIGDQVETIDNLNSGATVKPDPQPTRDPDGKSLGMREYVPLRMVMVLIGSVWGWQLVL